MDDSESLLDQDGRATYDEQSGPTRGSGSVSKDRSHSAASAFGEALEGEQFEVKDPGEVTDRSKWTPTQVEQWDTMLEAEEQYFSDLEEFQKGERDGADVRKPLIADLGGIGSGKTYSGAGLIAPRQVQMYEGSIGLFCANTREQTEQTLIPRFKEGMAALGFSWDRASYHKSITYRGQVYKHTIAIELVDGTYSFIRIGSFSSADRLESEEFDWGVLSEVQSADELAFKKVRRRIRTMHANALVYAEGTPKKASHWQYDSLPEMGFDVWMSDTRDNPHKQPGYASDLRAMYGANRADAMVAGHPIKESTDAIFYNFDRDLHVESDAAQELTHYDEGLPLHIFVDFNLSPMSVALFQPKSGAGFPGFADTVYAQVDEYEGWQGGTRQVMRAVYDDYGDHLAGGMVNGDGTETNDTTSPDTTDWDIVKEELGQKMPAMKVQAGVYREDSDKEWKNPPIKNRINAGNWFLQDGHGLVHTVFLPESEYDSGGVKDSVAELEKNDEGKIDKTVDKTDARDATQSHFSDAWSYLAFYIYQKSGHGGGRTPADKVENLEKMVQSGGTRMTTGVRTGTFTDF